MRDSVRQSSTGVSGTKPPAERRIVVAHVPFDDRSGRLGAELRGIAGIAARLTITGDIDDPSPRHTLEIETGWGEPLNRYLAVHLPTVLADLRQYRDDLRRDPDDPDYPEEADQRADDRMAVRLRAASRAFEQHLVAAAPRRPRGRPRDLDSYLPQYTAERMIQSDRAKRGQPALRPGELDAELQTMPAFQHDNLRTLQRRRRFISEHRSELDDLAAARSAEPRTTAQRWADDAAHRSRIRRNLEACAAATGH